MTDRHRINFLGSEPDTGDPWRNLRAAIFLQAIADWNASTPKSKKYVLDTYSKFDKAKRGELLYWATVLNLKWCEAAEVYDFFHDGDADMYLVDTPFTGSELWEMFITGSWNRGGIKDKPYRPSELPTDKEIQRLVLTEPGDHLLYTTFYPRSFNGQRKETTK